MYGDPTSFDLRHALSTHLGCAMGNVVVGEGIDGLLGYLVRLLVDAGDTLSHLTGPIQPLTITWRAGGTLQSPIQR